MATADTINSIITHLETDYESLENIGAELENVDRNIENIASVVNGIYDNLPKTTGESSNLSLTTLKGKMNLGLKGDTSQNGTPTPDTPIDIEVVTGTQEVKVENVNILPLTIASKTSTTGITVTKNSDNSYHISGTASALNLFNSSNTMTLKANTQYTLGLSNGNGNVQISLRNSSGTQIAKTETTKFVTFTPSEDVEVYLYIRVPSGATVDETIYPMLVYGNVSLSEYTPHQEQVQTISLGDIELCKIGNYQDYLYKSNDKWYKKEYIGKTTFVGSGWTLYQTKTKTCRFVTQNYKGNISPKANTIVFSNYFEGYESNITIGNVDDNGVAPRDDETGFTLQIDKTLASDITTLYSWLSTHNTEVYYVLKTPNDIEITNSSLIEQLDNLEKLKSYNGTTNISSNGNLPMILGVSALKGE